MKSFFHRKQDSQSAPAKPSFTEPYKFWVPTSRPAENSVPLSSASNLRADNNKKTRNASRPPRVEEPPVVPSASTSSRKDASSAPTIQSQRPEGYDMPRTHHETAVLIPEIWIPPPQQPSTSSKRHRDRDEKDRHRSKDRDRDKERFREREAETDVERLRDKETSKRYTERDSERERERKEDAKYREKRRERESSRYRESETKQYYSESERDRATLRKTDIEQLKPVAERTRDHARKVEQPLSSRRDPYDEGDSSDSARPKANSSHHRRYRTTDGVPSSSSRAHRDARATASSSYQTPMTLAPTVADSLPVYLPSKADSHRHDDPHASGSETEQARRRDKHYRSTEHTSRRERRKEIAASLPAPKSASAAAKAHSSRQPSSSQNPSTSTSYTRPAQETRVETRQDSRSGPFLVSENDRSRSQYPPASGGGFPPPQLEDRSRHRPSPQMQDIAQLVQKPEKSAPVAPQVVVSAPVNGQQNRETSVPGIGTSSSMSSYYTNLSVTRPLLHGTPPTEISESPSSLQKPSTSQNLAPSSTLEPSPSRHIYPHGTPASHSSRKPEIPNAIQQVPSTSSTLAPERQHKTTEASQDYQSKPNSYHPQSNYAPPPLTNSNKSNASPSNVPQLISRYESMSSTPAVVVVPPSRPSTAMGWKPPEPTNAPAKYPSRDHLYVPGAGPVQSSNDSNRPSSSMGMRQVAPITSHQTAGPSIPRGSSAMSTHRSNHQASDSGFGPSTETRSSTVPAISPTDLHKVPSYETKSPSQAKTYNDEPQVQNRPHHEPHSSGRSAQKPSGKGYTFKPEFPQYPQVYTSTSAKPEPTSSASSVPKSSYQHPKLAELLSSAPTATPAFPAKYDSPRAPQGYSSASQAASRHREQKSTTHMSSASKQAAEKAIASSGKPPSPAPQLTHMSSSSKVHAFTPPSPGPPSSSTTPSRQSPASLSKAHVYQEPPSLRNTSSRESYKPTTYSSGKQLAAVRFSEEQQTIPPLLQRPEMVAPSSQADYPSKSAQSIQSTSPWHAQKKTYVSASSRLGSNINEAHDPDPGQIEMVTNQPSYQSYLPPQPTVSIQSNISQSYPGPNVGQQPVTSHKVNRVASEETLLMTPSSLAPSMLKPTVSRTSIPASVSSQQEQRKKGFFGMFKSKPQAQPDQYEIWRPPTRETQPPPAVTESKLSSRVKPPAPIEVPISGRKSPNSKVFTPFRYLTVRRHRTVSAASAEAVNGTAPNTVFGSPTASQHSQNPMQPPPMRDPSAATREWRDEMKPAVGRSKIQRPGVVFDVKEDPSEDKPRSKRLTPSRRDTGPPPAAVAQTPSN